MPKTLKKKKQETASETKTPIELVFDGREVTGVWYHPELRDVICGLCGKECEIMCHNVNPYCG